jgi:membrane associated rhomboid family serine protease
MDTVSTTASGILYAILAVKILFFIKYRAYEPLSPKRAILYGLFGLIFGINIIVLFVGGNVDVGGHVGGLLTGLFYGTIFYEFE